MTIQNVRIATFTKVVQAQMKTLICIQTLSVFEIMQPNIISVFKILASTVSLDQEVTDTMELNTKRRFLVDSSCLEMIDLSMLSSRNVSTLKQQGKQSSFVKAVGVQEK